MNRCQMCFISSPARNAQSACVPSMAPRLSSIIRKQQVCAWRGATALLVVFAALLLPELATAQTLTGAVKNSTTGKPAAGDEVVLLSLRQGMEEAGRTTADAEGKFSFKLNNHAVHLIRAIHEGVTYHRIVPPGTRSVAVEVYDVSKKVDGIEIFTDIMYLRPLQGQLVVTREFAVRNSSTPPRTQMNQRNLEFYIPDDARILNASVMPESASPLRSAPVPEGEKNRYSFLFPLRPGLTRFEVTYSFPYKGNASLDPNSAYPLKHFVVVMPKSMQFKAASSSKFQSIQFPDQRDSNVEMASDIPKGNSLAFGISGEGQVGVREQGGTQGEAQNAQNSGSATQSAQSNGRPGGGLGLPIDAPDPLQKYRWWILGGLAAVLLIGGIYFGGRHWGTPLQRTSR